MSTAKLNVTVIAQTIPDVLGQLQDTVSKIFEGSTD